jgi:hypothetical protein
MASDQRAIILKTEHRLFQFIDRSKAWFLSLPVEGRCYSLGIAVAVVAGVLRLFGNPAAGMLAGIGAAAFVSGLLPLIERLYEWAWKNLLGKLIIAGLIALATNMAYGFGRQMVAELIGTSPEPFAATVNVATILLSPVLFLLALAVGGIFIFFIALYVGMLASMAFLTSQRPGKGKRACLWFCRFVALAIAVFGSWSVLNHSAGYTGWVSRRTASYLYTFDMYLDAKYTNGKDQKTALLADGRLLVGAPSGKEGYAFEVRESQGESKPSH